MPTAVLTKSDLRWLICKGYIEHAREITLSGEEGRSFRRNRSSMFHKRSSFVLIEKGVLFATAASAAKTFVEANYNGNGNSSRSAPIPTWDRDRQELRLAGQLIKQFKVPAANQQAILATFEEEQWPPRVDDPLKPHPDHDSKRRLQDTINSLNRNQKNSLIRFHGDGSGQGIRWELVARHNELVENVGTHNGSGFDSDTYLRRPLEGVVEPHIL